MPLNKTANIKFNEHGEPYSADFDDIYFDHQHGSSQSEQVFLDNNHIPKVWHTFRGDKFSIVETGFGSGLNFFITAAKFIQFKQSNNSPLSLHFISCDKYPLNKDDFAKVMALWPQYSDLSSRLLQHYDPLQNSLDICFDELSIRLTIYFDDATESLSKLSSDNAQHIDAFYLDGFAPSRNRDMWNDDLFAQLALLARKGATIGTFTVAGFVRRGLEAVGFKLEKHEHNDDAYKSESTKGRFVGVSKQKPLTGFKIRSKVESSQHATIIGGGLAAACTALALAKRNIKVTVLCQDDEIAMGASSNAIGAIYPLLHQQKDTISEFYQLGFEHSLKLFQQLLAEGYQFSHGFDGLIEVSFKHALVQRQQKFAELNAWPNDLIHPISAEQTNEISGINVDKPGLFMPRAGWVCPPELVKAIMKAANDTGNVKVKLKRKLESVKQVAKNRWLITTNKEQKQVQNVIFCTGADSLDIDILGDLPLSAVRGQVTQMQTNATINNLKTVLCHKGYLTPANNGMHCIGATFDKDDVDLSYRQQDDEYNLNMLDKCLGDIAGWQLKDVKGGKARLRCCTPDHLPVVGRLPEIELHKEYYQHLSKDKNWHFKEPAPFKPGLYILSGLGARGLCSAPLLAEILAAELCNDEQIVDEEMLFNLSTNRFVIRDMIKRK
ncbi:bifunctional tRNA (5-methylaminomethyl-2-thiouridine)(34)-methyltransferase MnmD/FAD-dependent 5-carboxymethylaminomethyl-2-thiouridine(34) oxidoreductase MnmC [Thalassotalea crassostreae]|uniref:bifunctional tRNA (5-methylaminomethyl-2-thiouridine)(34)-methyltransferase MnmD/FAD-dependent 5-carboxymethylaminomethyl-2-thiouridine(34) oxidoreductase MnmC n=1 Tax=Thalassotalea crassostreae TaxID=1763536 RepID=UPI000A45E44D|nr:bifunctional tRNA (5-methylaminomethyl-2-thiouridine)(34)-methyltransferase MnmD/FAD-dependent 5-carboxymethylaminomethyl-2-thiouridine(34) oxidoreductase MnmC [Thalassotalea crassostreae]